MAYSRNLRMPRRNMRAAAASRQRGARKLMVRAFRGAAYFRSANRTRRVLSGSGGAEIKLVDGTAANPGRNILPLNSTGSITPVNLIASGSGFNNRIGRKIDMVSLHLHGLVSQTGVVVGFNDYVRICVIYDRQTNGILPAYSDIFRNYDQASATASSAFSDLNPDERERFAILADFRLTLPATAASGLNGSVDALQNSFNINRFIKLNLSTMYKGDSAPSVIGDIATGSLYITTMGSVAAGSEAYQAPLSWRLRYRDT